MADMVLLKCDIGSKAATVLCPECGRISRQILSASYLPNGAAELIRPYTCPICKTVYQTCSSGQAGNLSATFARYNNRPAAYNDVVKADYTRKAASQTQPAPTAPSKPTRPIGFDTIASCRKKTEGTSDNSASATETSVVQPVVAEEDLPSTVVSYPLPFEAQGKPLNAISMPTQASEEVPAVPDEDLDRKIERWKRELLDTGKRNKMINYRETKRATLRILEPEASELFNRLAFSDRPLTFQKPINKDTDLRTYSMIALMETLSYSLNVQVGDIKTAGTIIETEKALKNLRSKAKLAQEEQGTNILYLCFGFIYWYRYSKLPRRRHYFFTIKS